MELHLLPGRPADWDDQIKGFAGKTLFHESAWLDYVTSAFPNVTIQYLQMNNGSSVAGYLCAMRTVKLMYVVWGSPLHSIGMYLGPLMRPKTNQRAFLRAVNYYCQRNGIADFELCNPDLNPLIMQSLGFQAKLGMTFETPLTGGEKCVWENMRGNCRTRIRKAEKSGLVGEVVSDPEIASIFYDQFAMALKQKGLTPEYGVERPRALFERLQGVDKLFAVCVRYQDKIIASAFYPHDERSMFFWDAGYDPEFIHLSPNELLHWTAMKAAIKRGIEVFEIGGAPNPSFFTRKFGGNLVPHVVFERSFVPSFDPIRNICRQVRAFGNAFIAGFGKRSTACSAFIGEVVNTAL